MSKARVLVFCWLGWFFDFYDLVLFAFVQTRVASDLRLTELELGWVIGLTFAATAIGGFWFGRVADRRGRRVALSLSILVYSAGAFATAFADGFATLLLARMVTGIGVGGEWGIGHAIVAEAFPERLRGRAAGILQAATPLAMASAAAVGLLLAPEIGWRACFLLSALPALLVFFVRRAIPGDEARSSAPFLALFRGRLLRPSVALLALLIVHMAAFWCTYSWMAPALLKEHKVTPATVFAYQLTVNLAQCAADVAFGFLADRFGRRRVFALFCTLFTCGLVVVALRYDSIRSDVTTFTIAMAIAGFGTGTWSCFGPLFAANYPESLRATAASGFYNLGRGAQFFMQPLMGWMIATTGTYEGALWVGATMGACSALLIAAVPAATPSAE